MTHPDRARRYAASSAAYAQAQQAARRRRQQQLPARDATRSRCSSTTARARTSSTSTATTTSTTCSAWGPGILGHAPPAVVRAVREAGRPRPAVRRPDARRGRARRAVPRRSSPAPSASASAAPGTEMVQAALRLARAATGRQVDRSSSRATTTAGSTRSSPASPPPLDVAGPADAPVAAPAERAARPRSPSTTSRSCRGTTPTRVARAADRPRPRADRGRDLRADPVQHRR